MNRYGRSPTLHSRKHLLRNVISKYFIIISLQKLYHTAVFRTYHITIFFSLHVQQLLQFAYIGDCRGHGEHSAASHHHSASLGRT